MGLDHTPGHEPNENNEPDYKLLAEDCGMSGSKFLGRQYEPDILAAIGRITTEQLLEHYVSPEQVSSLHPDIKPESARSYALDMSTKLALQRVSEVLGRKSIIGESEFRQVLAGTAMASSEALAVVAMSLETSSKSIIEEAQQRRWEQS